MITIVKPGLLTTVQDLGRYGYQKYGIVTGGAMDSIAHRIANILVGNEENFATLEVTLQGPTIHFHEDTIIAICGANLSPSINGQKIRLWRSIFVKKDSVLTFGRCQYGCRAYIAFAGGLSVPTIMGSKSTYLRAHIGGWKGRRLQAGDQLHLETPSHLSQKMMESLQERGKVTTYKENNLFISPYLFYLLRKNFTIRIIKDRQFSLFTEESQQNIDRFPFEIQTQSDRMGYRLKGPTLTVKKAEEMISEAVSFGTVQVPPDGNPIILLADRQTTGGYPKMGHVASVDLPILAQAKPGDQLYFSFISTEEAQSLYIQREKQIRDIRKGMYLKFCK